tara:strand:+ start:250 stop:522 length:273 start_codon:yes stop_codon:yes gene_type:complete
VLNLSAICLKGRNKSPDIEIKRNNVPKEIVSPFKLLNPPHQTSKPIHIEVDISAIGKKIEFIQTVLNHASLCLILISLKFLISKCSLLKI